MEETSALPGTGCALDNSRRPILTNLDQGRLTRKLRSSLFELPLGGIGRDEIGLEGKALIPDQGQGPEQASPHDTHEDRDAKPDPDAALTRLSVHVASTPERM